MSIFTLAVLAIGCTNVATLPEVDGPAEEPDPYDVPDEERDIDGDGVTADEDCDDEDAEVLPGGDEGDEADGKDNDCNGTADDRSVCEDDVADYGTITQAIEDAPDGFVILVCPGVYPEDLLFDDREITIRSTDGAESTTIQGSGASSVVTIMDGEVGLQGFTVTGGLAENGGGLYADQADLDVRENLFLSNIVTGMGGGVFLGRSSGVFEDNTISSNEALEGGGLAVSKGSMEITGNEISGNVATTIDEEYRGAGSGGGGIWMDGGSNLTGNLIDGNESFYNGAGIILFQTTGTLDGNTVRGNYAHEDGAGIYANQSSSHILNNVVEDNQAADDAGGLRSYVGRMTIEFNTFQGNTAGDDGGGLKMSHSSNTVRDNEFLYNSAGDAGGGVELDNETPVFEGGYFEGNTAYRGGGMHSWRDEGRFTLTGLEFVENVASDCGGALAMDNNPYQVTIEYSSFTDNDAVDGAAFCMDYALIDAGEETEHSLRSSAVMRYSFISDNDVTDDAAIAYVKAGDLTMVNVTTHDNDSASAGIVVKLDGTFTAHNVIFSGVEGGMVLLEDDGTAAFSYCAFDDVADNWWGLDSPVGSDGNEWMDPDFDDADGLDFHLGSGSECVDAGDPDHKDPDGSRSDIGAYGGPGAE